jgi:hypothetical protein
MVSDAGRHIKNGEIFFKEHKILSTNYYSYTNTNFPFPTHHWGVGVIYYVIWKTSGFEVLSAFNTLLIVLALFFFYKSAERLVGFKLAFLFSLLVVPLLMSRVEIRPENFSYLFSGIAFFMLIRFDLKEIGFKWLLITLVIIQILWVNIHIFFVFNFVFVGAFWLHNLINHKSIKNHSILLGALVLSSMVSPFHVKALLEPLTIFHNFDMQITENFPVPFLEEGHLFQNVYFFYFKLIFLIAAVNLVLVLIKKNLRSLFVYLLLFLFISILTWRMNRFECIFGLMMIPIMALNHKIIVENYNIRLQTILYCMISYVIINFFIIHSFSMLKISGLGIENEKMNNAAYFFRKNKLSGPIMNNMNIGSYLIFHLFPKEKVFYDARPEAYPSTFIRDVYRQIMQKPEKWNEGLENYKFNVIFFYKVIMTDYEKSFLEQRLKDSQWKVVYNDDYSIILMRV